MGSLRATNQAASQNALHSLTDATVHVLDGDASAQSAIAAALAPLRVVVESFLDRKLFRTAAEQLAAQPGCAIVDCGASSDEVMALLESLTSSPDELVRPTIVVSAHASVAMAVAAMQRRAWTVLEKPLSLWGCARR